MGTVTDVCPAVKVVVSVPVKPVPATFRVTEPAVAPVIGTTIVPVWPAVPLAVKVPVVVAVPQLKAKPPTEGMVKKTHAVSHV